MNRCMNAGKASIVVFCLVLATAATPTAAIAQSNTCPTGSPSCVDSTIAEMRARFAPLGRACRHNAIFALDYLRTTQAIKWFGSQPGYFTDPAWINRESALFAQYYFTAYDNWLVGRSSAVPTAWQIAFDAAWNKEVTAAGNILLGFNAHINRDLPYVLAAIGLTKPDGTSRKPDQDKVNTVFAPLIEPISQELISRFDPYGMEEWVPPEISLALVTEWREQAWINAQRLIAAPTASARAAVAAEIDAWAAAQALAIWTLSGYNPPFSSATWRDLHCALHHADTPPAYPFGTPTAY
jgi:hypothetical protein